MWTYYITALLILQQNKGIPVLCTTTTTCLEGAFLLGLGFMGVEWGLGLVFHTCVQVWGLTV